LAVTPVNAATKPRADGWSMLMIFAPITISGIGSMHTVFTEFGKTPQSSVS